MYGVVSAARSFAEVAVGVICVTFEDMVDTKSSDV
jgi:hypothetical protein